MCVEKIKSETHRNTQETHGSNCSYNSETASATRGFLRTSCRFEHSCERMNRQLQHVRELEFIYTQSDRYKSLLVDVSVIKT